MTVVTGPFESSADGQRLIDTIAAVVEHLGEVFPGIVEIVLHDVSRLPDSIVAISGDVTGRRVGSPATSRLLAALQHGDDTVRESVTTTPAGEVVRSSTMFIHDAQRRVVAALCVNVDITAAARLNGFLSQMLGPMLGPADPIGKRGDRFPVTVEALARKLLDDAIRALGGDVLTMNKQQKMRVVERLEAAGFFLLRDGMELASRELCVTKFTIYNYRNELATGRHPGGRGDHG